MSGMTARCLVSRLSECLLVVSEQAAGPLLVKITPSIGEGQRTSGISESGSIILERFYCYRPSGHAVITREAVVRTRKQTFSVSVCYR
jgi:hypothetical protein